ncbi:MAG TPA: hypothetical protein VJ206_08245 [bacterium]|jgi:hypothetical protein|nr:hypothetical protein [bacterium]
MPATQNTVRLAGLIGLAIAGAAAGAFVAAAGGQAGVARYGGAAWVFILAWIITMPVLAPSLKRRGSKGAAS